MNSIAQIYKSIPAPRYTNAQVGCILAYLAETTPTESLSDNSTVGLAVLLKSLSESVLALEA